MGGRTSKAKGEGSPQDSVEEVAESLAPPAAPPAPPPASLPASSASAQVKAKVTRVHLPFKAAEDKRKVSVVVLSDTHNYAHKIYIPNADILLHAGDFTVRGTEQEIQDFDAWLASLPHKHKIVVAGNHEVKPELLPKYIKHAVLLRDAPHTIKLEGGSVRIFGTSWHWHNYPEIPSHLDILLSHHPPTGHCDIIYNGESVGSDEIRDKINAVKPLLHIAGHNHEGYRLDQDDHTVYLNAATCVGSANSSMRRNLSEDSDLSEDWDLTEDSY